ncbi:MAG: hypothetical protein BGO31_06580 [Bacteroidetes bacterium 43-16]|nr:MAG: hypothetical protein BGO31_06580 [Bacteroidetes bacterium 43-16]
MKNKFTLALAALAISGAANAQTWEHDTVITGTGYMTNVYYSLENGTAGTAAADNWHLGLSASRFSEAIITNSADKSVRIFELASDTADYGDNLTTALSTAITAHPMSLYNSNINWSKGAFNQGTAPYGWATYDGGTHWLVGTKIFGLITGTDTLQAFIKEKQTTPAGASPVYVIKTAKIDGTNAQTYTINASASAGRNFTYMNILTGATLEREPLSADWDFLFTNYNDAAVVFQNTQYKVFGILNNDGVEVAKVDTVDTEFDNLDYTTYTYDTSITSIGRAWKASGQNGTVVEDSLTYFIKVNNGDVWQIVFTAHNSGTAATDPGLAAFKKRKVFAAPVDTGTSVKNINNNIGMLTVAPNPAGNIANIVLDAKANLGAITVSITDINGRTVQSFTKNINAGFQQLPINLNGLATGMYIIRLNGASINTATKLIKE